MAARERIGLAMPIWEGLAIQEQVEIIQYADALGYEVFWMGEAWGQEVFSTLAWLSARTSNIQLGVGIANVFSRTPGLMAQSTATLDRLSGGRAVLGLGTSGRIVVENWHGVPFDRSVQRLREYTEIVRMALHGERVDYDGTVFKLRGFKMRALPDRPDIPIYIASISPAGIRVTGQVADGWFPIWMKPEYITENVANIQATASAAGRSPNAVEIAAGVHCAASPDPAARDLARSHIAYYIGGMGVFYYESVQRQGFAEAADAIRAAYVSGDRKRAADLVPDAMLDSIMAVGDTDTIRQRIDAYRSAGVSLPIVEFVHGLSNQQIRDTIAALAPR